MRTVKVLVIEDEKDILDLISYNLIREGYQVSTAASGRIGMKKAGTEFPDLILLDLMIPEIDGLEVCRRLKSDTRTAGIPIVMVTAKGEETDIVVGLEIGADDYITKPFSTKVLLARVKAVLRRKEKAEDKEKAMIVAGDIVIDKLKYKVTVTGESVDLTSTEFKLLLYLAGKPGWVFTRNQIIESVQGEGYPVTDRSVDVQIVGLRKKLGESGALIETVRGVGYRFKDL